MVTIKLLTSNSSQKKIFQKFQSISSMMKLLDRIIRIKFLNHIESPGTTQLTNFPTAYQSLTKRKSSLTETKNWMCSCFEWNFARICDAWVKCWKIFLTEWHLCCSRRAVEESIEFSCRWMIFRKLLRFVM